MKKIFALCVVCLFIATVCQAADSKFNPREEAPTPQNRACACSKVDFSQKYSPIEFHNMMIEQLEKDLLEAGKIDPKDLSDEEKEVIEDAQKMAKELKGYDFLIPAIYAPNMSPSEIKRTIFRFSVYRPKDGKPITIRGKETSPSPKSKSMDENSISLEDYWNATKDTMTKLHKIVMKHSRITH